MYQIRQDFAQTYLLNTIDRYHFLYKVQLLSFQRTNSIFSAVPQILMDEIGMLEADDIIHLADCRGHDEGAALGEGEIENLPEVQLDEPINPSADEEEIKVENIPF